MIYKNKMFAPEPYFPDYPDDVQGQQTKTEEPSNILVPDEQDAPWKGTLFTLPYKQAKEYEVKHYPDGTIMPMTYEEWSKNVRGYTGKDGILPDNALADGYKGRGYTLGQAYNDYRNKVSADNAAYLKRKYPATIEEKRRALGLNPYWKGNDYTNSLFTTFGAPLAGAMLLPAASAFAGTGVASAVGNGAVQAFNWAMPKVALPYLGGKVVDEGSKLVTGKSWAENVRDRLISWGVPEDWAQATGDLSNPAYIAPYGRMAESIVAPTKKGLDKAFDFLNSPLTGKWTQFGNREYRFKPNQVGINGVLPESRPVLNENMRKAGWTLTRDGYAVNPKVSGYFEYVNGKWQPFGQAAKINITKAQVAKAQTKEMAQIAEFKAKEKVAQQNLAELEKMGFYNFQPKTWFKDRDWMNGAPGAVTKEDVAIWKSHLPEYLNIAKKITGKSLYKDKSGRWIGKFANGDMDVVPEEYIVAHSKAFKNAGLHYDGHRWHSGMSKENFNNLLHNGGIGVHNWTSNTNNVTKTYGEAVNMVGKGRNEKLIQSPPNAHSNNFYGKNDPIKLYVDDNYDATHFTRYFDDGSGAFGETKVFSPQTQIKALRGNNGNFNMKILNPFKSLAGPVLGGTTLYETYNE